MHHYGRSGLTDDVLRMRDMYNHTHELQFGPAAIALVTRELNFVIPVQNS